MPRQATVRNRFWPDAISRHAPDRIWIRTAGARDVESLADYFAQLTQPSRHNRFMSALVAELREQPQGWHHCRGQLRFLPSTEVRRVRDVGRRPLAAPRAGVGLQVTHHHRFCI